MHWLAELMDFPKFRTPKPFFPVSSITAFIQFLLDSHFPDFVDNVVLPLLLNLAVHIVTAASINLTSEQIQNLAIRRFNPHVHAIYLFDRYECPLLLTRR